MVKNLKKIRESMGISQRDLGKMVGVEQQTISGYESFSDPSNDILCKLAECLGTNTDFLLGRTDNQASLRVMHENELSDAESLMVREYREQDELGKELIENTLKSLHKMKKNK